MYKLPIWSHKPKNCEDGEWYLEEIKNGTVVSKHILNDPVTTFGRIPLQLPPSVVNGDDPKIAYKSIVTAHESCSRLHARIAFDTTGTPWLRDLGSGNGTTINKKKLPPQSIGKLEANTSSTMKKQGSRGVVVYPGDVIQFGASTRIYVLNGPSYFDRGAMKARRQMMLLKDTQNTVGGNDYGSSLNSVQSIRNDKQDDEGVSWGMDFDIDHSIQEETDTDESQSTANNTQINLDDPSTIPEKHRKLYDKLQSKKYKLQNVQTEMRRIQTKAITVELSTGQQATLERNEKQEQLLEQEIQKLYNELQSKLNRSGNTVSGGDNISSSSRRNAKDFDDVDDFYDRTSKQSDSNTNPTLETMESLTSKWYILVSKLQSQKHVMTKAQSKVNEIQKEIKEAKANGDDDCFFLQNDLEIADDEYEKIQKDQKQLSDELDSTEKMVLIINDKIIFDRVLKFIGNQGELDLLRENNNKDDLAKKEMDMMPSPSLPSKRKVEKSRDASSNELMPPPPPMMMKSSSKTSASTKQVCGPMMPPPKQVSKAISAAKDVLSTGKTATTKSPNALSKATATKRKRQGPTRPPVIGTLQAILQTPSSCAPNNKQNKSKKLKNTKNNETFNPKVDQWVAPKEQDGSGKTKLNAKFQGRY